MTFHERLELPSGWRARVPGEGDVEAIIDLLRRQQRRLHGSCNVDALAVRSLVVGAGSWTRRQVVVESPGGGIAAWASVHDRAAGRTVLTIVVDPGPDGLRPQALPASPASNELMEQKAAAVGEQLCRAAGEVGLRLARERGLEATQLDCPTDAADTRAERWLAEAGYRRTRTWLEMTRPVTSADAAPDAFPPPRAGVHLRRVRTHSDGTPQASELQAVHRVLEESFVDHFNSYRESFPEFIQRMGERAGNDFDHWWLVTVDPQDPAGGPPVVGGALVSSTQPPDENGTEGSYVEYLGVHRLARGRGVAKTLLHAAIRDAAERGRNRVELEVDADSPTHADQLYTSMGWRTAYRTHTWHKLATCTDSGGSKADSNESVPTESARTERQVLQAVRDWDRAMVSNDALGIGRFMGEEWVIIGPDGAVTGKTEFLAQIESGDLAHDEMTSEDLDVRSYGDTAIVFSHGVSGGTYQGRSFREQEGGSNVFVRRDDRWVCVLTHLALGARERVALRSVRLGVTHASRSALSRDVSARDTGVAIHPGRPDPDELTD